MRANWQFHRLQLPMINGFCVKLFLCAANYKGKEKINRWSMIIKRCYWHAIAPIALINKLLVIDLLLCVCLCTCTFPLLNCMDEKVQSEKIKMSISSFINFHIVIYFPSAVPTRDCEWISQWLFIDRNGATFLFSRSWIITIWWSVKCEKEWSRQTSIKCTHHALPTS